MIGRKDILDARAYERVRAAFRDEVVELRRSRRVLAGERITLVFENERTILFRIQEELRASGAADEASIEEAIARGSPLASGPGRLAGNLYLEIRDSARIREDLEPFAGLDRGGHLAIEMEGEDPVAASFPEEDAQEGRLLIVRRVEFLLQESRERAFLRRDQPAALVVEHAIYRARAPLAGALRAALCDDLRGTKA